MTMIVGIDDTDSLDSRGTNKLARAIAEHLAPRFACRMIVRHQLLFDERIPFTSHNGSAGLWFESLSEAPTLVEIDALFAEIREFMLDDFIDGSDPGLCLAVIETKRDDQWDALYEWGRRCQREIVTQSEARTLATHAGVRLEGLGGTDGGIIGALAAVGLTNSGHDGRLVRWQSHPDDLSGPTPITTLRQRQIEVRAILENNLPMDDCSTSRLERTDGTELFDGIVDVGKHLRPNLRDHRAVLFVTKVLPPSVDNAGWAALKLK